ncbi:hypothetical protein NQD34_008540 [Periophthalmus magnuspinnatus]|nr:hypothetical protein NQD34_008540 [Periophthalmus magnuspinnatus]
MAEAAVPPLRFFCYICKSETTPNLPDLVCPKCDSGFIEEVEENSSLLQNNTSSQRSEPNSIFSELWQMLFMERSALLSNPSSESEHDDSEASSANSSSLSSISLISDPLEPRESQTLNDQGPSSSSSSSLSEESPEDEGVLQQFFAGLFNITSDSAAAATPSNRDRWRALQLHSNPGDYAWGQRGLDAVITDLLGRFDNAGPPPADKDSISSLPTVCISKEHTDSRLECPVCREEYSVGEWVRQLPCLHYFHSDCIVPWLKLHDTCPVCRKSLSGVDHCLSSSLSLRSDTSPEESEELEDQARAMCQ